MANIKKRRNSSLTSGGWQAYTGPGVLVAAIFNHHASSSGNIVTIYDGFSTSDYQLFTRTSDTDAGTTVPIILHTDGDLVAGTSTANVHLGIPFARGVFLNKTGDTTHADDYTLFIRRCQKVSVQLVGATDTGKEIADGPGIMYGYRIKPLHDQLPITATADILFKDSHIPGSGNTLMTKTNYDTLSTQVRPVVTTTGSDEGGSAVTTAATGAYNNTGIYFASGLNVSLAQGDAGIPDWE